MPSSGQVADCLRRESAGTRAIELGWLCNAELRLGNDPDGTRHDWLEEAVAITVADSRYTAGVANLRAEIAWQRKSGAARERALP